LDSGDIVEMNFDGTYLTTPAPYMQTWIIMGVVGQKVFPLITALMTGPKKSLNKATLAKIKDLYPNFNPQKAMGDFELAARNVVRETYPRVAFCLPSNFITVKTAFVKLSELA
jgi:hypothetical protein